MTNEALPEGIHRDLKKAARLGRNKAWDAIILAFIALSSGALGYTAYRRLKGDLEPDDPIAGFIDTAKRLKTAGSNPAKAFFELPGGKRRTSVIVEVFKYLAHGQSILIPPSPPLLFRASESGPLGGIYLQEVEVGVPSAETGRRKRTDLSALVGRENRLYPISIHDPDRRKKIQDIISQYSVGPAAIAERRRIMEN